jgi:hypothetical protein
MNPLTPERLAEIEKYCSNVDVSRLKQDDSIRKAFTDIPDLLGEVRRLEGLRKFDYARIRVLSRKAAAAHDEIQQEIHDINAEEEAYRELHKDYTADLLGEIKRLRDREIELTDLLDLAHDEFQRIEAIADEAEITGIALRGQAKIRQNVPVIRQRDELENAVIKLNGLNDKLSAQLSDAQAALTKAQIQHGSCSVCGFTAWQERDKNTQHCLYCDAQAALRVSQARLDYNASTAASKQVEIVRLQGLLKEAHDAMHSWHSSEYADHPLSQKIGREMYQSAALQPGRE